MTALPASLVAALQDRYRLDGELGQGGMATVYLAHDLKHDRDVALKVLRPELAAMLGAERFLREIRLTAKLQHPHIVTLIDSGEVGGGPSMPGPYLYYVLPYIEGESLRERVTREGQLPLDEALRITRAVAGALQYAHDQGVIHRDIKPENILLSRGEPVVADFGIALAAASAGRERLTETGLSLGTPAYMSPEQASAEPRLDGRSDQYSLACVVYEMLAGEPPYTGSTAQAIIAKRLSEPVPKLGTLRQVPAGVEAAVTRALAKRPADRFGSVAEFAAALERPAAPSRHGITRRAAALIGGLAVAGLAAIGAFLTRSRPPEVTTHRQVTFSGSSDQAALSPDHRWLAYANNGRLVVGDLTSAAAPVSIGPVLRWAMSSFSPVWSPDGSTLFYFPPDSARTGMAIYALVWPGGPARRISTEMCSGLSIALRADALYCGQWDSMVAVLDPRTGARTRSASLAPAAPNIGALAVSPDGEWLAFVAVRGSSTFLALSRPDGSKQRRLVDNVPRFGSLGWSRSSDAIYYLKDLGNGANISPAGDVMRLRIDRGSGEPRGPPTPVMSGAFVRSFALSVDGKTLAYVKAPPQQRIWAMTLDGPAAHSTIMARELTTGTAVYGTPDISSDGRWVAFVRNDGGNGNIFVTPFDSFVPHAVVSSAADEWSPRWSPDGTRLAYTTRDSGRTGVFTLDVRSGEVHQVSAAAVAPLGTITWTPDGRQVVFPLDLGSHYAVVDVATGDADTMAAPDSATFHITTFSPDGSELAVNGYPRSSGVPFLWRGAKTWEEWSPLRKTMVSELTPPLLWTADGWVYFLEDNALWRVGARGNERVRLVTLPEPCSGWQTALSADARRLVCTVEKSEPDIWLAEPFDPEMQK